MRKAIPVQRTATRPPACPLQVPEHWDSERARGRREKGFLLFPVVFGPLTVDTGVGNDERQVHFLHCIRMLGHIGMSEVDRQGALHGGSLYMDVRTRLGACVPVTRRGQLLSVLS